MRVFKLSVAKRVMPRMPDCPAVSFAQFSSLPAPREVIMPAPVTTTIGRPMLSLPAVISTPSVDALDERQAFPAPMADAGDQHLLQRALHRLFETARVTWRKQFAVLQRQSGES